MTTAELHEILDDENRKLTADELKEVVYQLERDCWGEYYKEYDRTNADNIDEMAKVLIDYTNKNHIMASHVILEDYAEQLYNAGYRKQEWISVDERLPEAKGACIACRFDGYVYKTFFMGTFPKTITHWMPLPEAPKMKGGAE